MANVQCDVDQLSDSGDEMDLDWRNQVDPNFPILAFSLNAQEPVEGKSKGKGKDSKGSKTTPKAKCTPKVKAKASAKEKGKGCLFTKRSKTFC